MSRLSLRNLVSVAVPLAVLALRVGPLAPHALAADQAPRGDDDPDVTVAPFDPSAYQPMPLPRHIDRPKGAAPRPRGRLETFDLRARVETLGQPATLPKSVLPPSGEVPGSGGVSDKGAPGGELLPENFSGLSLVADPTAGNYPNHVKLFTAWPNGSNTVGSGTLIDPLHVVTVGHCVHDNSRGGWATTVTVVPAYNNGAKPFGDAGALQLHSWSGWTSDEDFDHDVALVDLDRPVGALTGWRGYGYHDDCSYFTGGTWEHDGYPAEGPYSGQFMYTQTGDFDDCETDPIFGLWYGNEVSYDRLSYGGQSGSGAVRADIVRAVLSNGTNSTTWDVRITSDKFSDIQSWINTDRPAAADLVPLTVTLSPGTITSGRRLTDLDFVVHNYGDAGFNGLLGYDIYLSTNNNISTTDVLLASGSVNVSIGIRLSVSIDAVLPLIPAATASGDYFVGVILDVADAATGNNDTDGQDAAPLTVDYCAPLAEPGLLSPANAATCLDFPVRLDWSDNASADGYSLQVGDACGAGTVYDIPVGSVRLFYAGSLTPNTTYFWRVIAKNDCGNYSLWTPCRTFTTAPAATGAVTLQDPDDQQTCVATAVTLNWLPIANAVRYDVQIGTACGLGSIVSRNFSDYDAAGLAAATTYYWRVRGENSCGVLGSWSPCFSFTTAPVAPGVPVLQAPANGATCLGPGTVLDWSDVAGAAVYQVELNLVCGAGGGLSVMIPESRLDLTTYGIPPGPFFWRVRAGAGCGAIGPWSACFLGTGDTTPPGAAGNVQSASHVASSWSADPTIDVSWTAPSGDACGNAGYSVLWDQLATSIPDAAIETAGLALTSPPQPDGIAHYFHVRPVDGAGNGSVETDVKHLGPFWIDATPPAVTVTSPNGGETWAEGTTQSVRWTASDATSGLASVALLYSTDGGASFLPLANVVTTDVSYDWTIPAAASADARLKVVALDLAGNAASDTSDATFEIVAATAVANDRPPVTAHALLNNVPNPFNPRTTIAYALPALAHVTLRIFDVQGRQVRVLVDGLRDGPAWHEAVWDALDDSGLPAASGVYFYRLETSGFVQTQRMALVR